MKNRWFFIFSLLFAISFSGTYFILKYKDSFKEIKGETSSVEESNIKTEVSNFSLENAPTESLRGKITKLTGDVAWQSRVATEEAKVENLTEVQQGERVVTGTDGSLAISFENAVNISISKNSDLDIVQTLPVNLVFLQNSGIVNYEKTGDSPVSVRSMHLIAVGSKEINVNVDKEKSLTTIKNVDGELKITFNDLNFNVKEITVTKGKTYVFNDKTRRGVLR